MGQGSNLKLLKPQFVSGSLESRRVVQVACGHVHSLVLTEDGEVYSWGVDNYGQLGIGRQTNEADPAKVSGSNGFETKVVSVACGGWTSYALDIDGNVMKFAYSIALSPMKGLYVDLTLL